MLMGKLSHSFINTHLVLRGNLVQGSVAKQVPLDGKSTSQIRSGPTEEPDDSRLVRIQIRILHKESNQPIANSDKAKKSTDQ